MTELGLGKTLGKQASTTGLRAGLSQEQHLHAQEQRLKLERDLEAQASTTAHLPVYRPLKLCFLHVACVLASAWTNTIKAPDRLLSTV